MSYSNLGFSLLGLVVEAVSGVDFPTYVLESVFIPLGMEIPYIRDLPAGSIKSSAVDMGRFLSAVIAQGAGGGGGVLDPASQAEMWRRQNSGSALDFDFSIGLAYWILELPSLPGETLVGHGGDLGTFHALLLVDPARSLGAFVMVNSASGLGSFSLAGIGIEALRAFGGASGQSFAPPRKPPKPAAFPAGLASRIAGDYASPNGLVRVKPKGDGASVFAFGTWMEGYYRDDGAIGMRAKILGIELPLPILKEIFVTVEDLEGEPILAMRSSGILMGIARKVESEPVPAAWSARSGTWVLAEEEAEPFLDSARLGVDKDTGLFMLTLSVQGQNQGFPVRASSDEALVVLGSGRNLGSTLEASLSGKDERLDLFGVKLKRK